MIDREKADSIQETHLSLTNTESKAGCAAPNASPVNQLHRNCLTVFVITSKGTQNCIKYLPGIASHPHHDDLLLAARAAAG